MDITHCYVDMVAATVEILLGQELPILAGHVSFDVYENGFTRTGVVSYADREAEVDLTTDASVRGLLDPFGDDMDDIVSMLTYPDFIMN